jgi:hypothetical protein
MNIDQIDEHIEPHHDAVVSGKPSFCTIYTGVRPILFFAKTLLFFRPKWQTLLTALIGALDISCPQETSETKSGL